MAFTKRGKVEPLGELDHGARGERGERGRRAAKAHVDDEGNLVIDRQASDDSDGAEAEADPEADA